MEILTKKLKLKLFGKTMNKIYLTEMKETKLVRFPNHDDYVYMEIDMNEFQEFHQSDSEIYGWYKDEFISIYKETK